MYVRITMQGGVQQIEPENCGLRTKITGLITLPIRIASLLKLSYPLLLCFLYRDNLLTYQPFEYFYLYMYVFDFDNLPGIYNFHGYIYHPFI